MTSSLSASAKATAVRRSFSEGGSALREGGRWSALVLGLAVFGLLVRAQETGEQKFAVSAHKYAFNPARIEVVQDDLVRVTFTTDDIPHSFTIDKYRIAKRVEPGKPVVFEFRADQPGRFPIYCNLALDEKCKQMVGELVVKAR
jgi:heme/copper-type cytochrome/quinol oxidase subunit 2